ncbi:CBS domain-containing protein [bacterium]|nr:CBS domain-containing protein [bacterium]
MRKTISNHMSNRLITIGWNEKMSTAHQKMMDQKIKHLPVTNERSEIVGVLSDRDVQRVDCAPQFGQVDLVFV